MDALAIQLEPREVTGKAVKHLRKAGIVPAVIHDHGKPSVLVMGPYSSLMKIYQQAGKRHPVELKTGDHTYTVLIKTVEFEPKKHLINHIVFNAVDRNQKVEAEIPVHIIGEIPAEKISLIIINQLDAVNVEALASALPDELTVDGTKLAEIGDKVTVADIVAPEGVVILDSPEQTIATVYEPGALAAANEAAAGDAEPEDATDVESEHESTAEEGTQAAEIRPGGKEEKEDKSQGHNPEKK